jgi:predicted transcriptional regulator
MSHQCQAITKIGKQCSRNAEPDSDFCWQHNNILNDLPNDVLQYTLNNYIDYNEDVYKLEQMIEDFKFDVKPHINTKVEYFKNGNIRFIKTYIDQVLIKNEGFYQNGNKYFEDNYNLTPEGNNKIKNGKQYVYNMDGTLKSLKEYKDGVLVK